MITKQIKMRLLQLSLLVILVIIQLSAQLSDSLRLTDFLELAKQNALAGEEAAADREVAGFNYGLFQASLRPQLNLNANFPNYFRTFSEITQPDGTVRFQPVTNNNSSVGLSLEQDLPLTGGTVFLETNLQRFDDFESDFNIYNGLPFRFGLSQPIFSFNSQKWRKRIAPLELESARRQYNVDLAGIELEATRLFFALLLATRNEEIAAANRAANQSLFKIAQERYELGKISQSDLVQLELGLISAQKNQMLAQNDVALAVAEVYTYLGRTYEGQQMVPISPDPLDTLMIAESEALSLAFQNRPELIDNAVQKLAADRELDRARRNNGPQLDLLASFGMVRSSMNLSDIYNDPRGEQIVQLRLSFPILDGGRRKNAVALASAQKDIAGRRAEQQELDLRKSVIQQLGSFQRLQGEIRLADKMQSLALRRLDISTESYLLGAISLTDLTLAQTEKDQTSREYTNTLRRYYLAYAELKRLCLSDQLLTNN